MCSSMKPSTSTNPLVKKEHVKEEQAEVVDKNQESNFIPITTKVSSTHQPKVKPEENVKDESNEEHNDSSVDATDLNTASSSSTSKR